MQESFVAFANSDGGDLYVGIEDERYTEDRFRGHGKPEDANEAIKVLLEQTTPAVENTDIEIIYFENKGYILHFSIPKSPKVHYSAQNKCFIRINASTREIKGDRILALGYAKGSYQYEKQPVKHSNVSDIEESSHLHDYMERISTHLSPSQFLKKQRLLETIENATYPTVAGVLLFDEEPQATMDTRCAVKLYRMKTTSEEYDRRFLESMPQTITGPLETMINRTLNAIDSMLEDTLYNIEGAFRRSKYPTSAIKEVIVNAVIHRDYSLSDDIHVIIFDNRIEIKSPGKLPGYITINNIYDERYSRNPIL